ncbi:MAG TPA: MBL fold metallo-hydrolase [Candidatus Paceibacterota bacterium]|nr:MBL fold metallo-hydrolase [Candidatus Paceibacterota bacterium]
MGGDKKLKLTFCSGAGTVTGANFLVEGGGKKFLIDCGLIQGSDVDDELNWDDFSYNPAEIDFLFITHAHIDHIGRIPKLINDGFRGKIFSVLPTKDITLYMLEDMANLVSRDTKYDLSKVYTTENIKKAMDMWKGLSYGEKIDEGDFSFSFKDAGHILGSGMLEIIYNGKKIIFTGDLGNSPSPLLPDTEIIKDADYLIMESVYGDRDHENRNERKKKLEQIIKDNYKRKGVLIIPTFSLERTQELLYEINSLVENNIVPAMPVFLDSPLSIKLTEIYLRSDKFFNKTAQNLIKSGDNLFDFPGLTKTPETEDSKDILKVPSPKIIIAGSGMSNGGRVLHHEKNYLPDKKNILLLTGYQTMGTMGRMIQDGAKKVRIMGQDVFVRAKIVFIDGYSGHKDSSHLVEFVENTAEKVKKVFVTMGEPKSSMFLAQRLNDELGVSAYAPDSGEHVFLDCK